MAEAQIRKVFQVVYIYACSKRKDDQHEHAALI